MLVVAVFVVGIASILLGSNRLDPAAVLDGLQDLVPAASWSVYRLGPRPALFLSAARGVPDTTRDCWRAYLSGPHRGDRSFAQTSTASDHAPLQGFVLLVALLFVLVNLAVDLLHGRIDPRAGAEA